MLPAMLQASLLAGACTVLLLDRPLASAFIYGLPAAINRFPYVVGLYYWPPRIDGKQRRVTVPFCTGTIVTLDWVITSYACVKADTGEIAGRFRPPTIEKPGNIRMVAGTGYAPTNTTTFEKYKYRTCTDWKFPEVDDLGKALELTPQMAEKIKSNQYEEKDVKGNVYHRYYLDYAALKVNEPWKFSSFVDSAPFPVGKRENQVNWWSNKVNASRYGEGYMQPCFTVGWGGWDETLPQLRLRYTSVKFVPYENCELSYCAECSYCNKTLRVNPKTEACFKAVVHGDACLGDEGAPIWCPWYGYGRTRQGRMVRTGSVVGFLSYRSSCFGKSLPSVYHHSWNMYSIITRIRGGAEWPPEMWIYGDTS